MTPASDSAVEVAAFAREALEGLMTLPGGWPAYGRGLAWLTYQVGKIPPMKLLLTREWGSHEVVVPKWGLDGDGSWVIVSWIGHGAHPYRILDPHSKVTSNQIRHKFFKCFESEASALAELLNTITLLRREEIARSVAERLNPKPVMGDSFFVNGGIGGTITRSGVGGIHLVGGIGADAVSQALKDFGWES